MLPGGEFQCRSQEEEVETCDFTSSVGRTFCSCLCGNKPRILKEKWIFLQKKYGENTPPGIRPLQLTDQLTAEHLSGAVLLPETLHRVFVIVRPTTSYLCLRARIQMRSAAELKRAEALQTQASSSALSQKL